MGQSGTRAGIFLYTRGPLLHQGEHALGFHCLQTIPLNRSLLSPHTWDSCWCWVGGNAFLLTIMYFCSSPHSVFARVSFPPRWV